MSGAVFRAVTEANDEAERRFAFGVRIAEALLFSSHVPLSGEEIGRKLPSGVDPEAVLAALERLYRPRGVQVQRVAGKWRLVTAPDLAEFVAPPGEEPRKLSRAALETLGIIAYHQPVTRAEIEKLRGVASHKGTLDLLLDAGFIRMRGRRRTPGRPVTFGTTEGFLVQFGLDRIGDLPGIEDLAGAGLVDPAAMRGFGLPMPSDDPNLGADEDPLESDVFLAMEEARLEALAEEPPLEAQSAPDAATAPDGSTPSEDN